MSEVKTIEGKTTSGFNYKILRENLENYELIEALGEAEENPLMFPKTVTLLLGKEQANKLKDHLRTENGTVSTEKMTNEIMEIFESERETKNS